MNSKIIVSISCTTFNHERYIRQCLDGFLMQECNFAFEVLIHDDASTDGTQAIIKEYQEKYPDIIKPYFQTVNQWSQGVRGMNAKYNFSRANGKYLAMCEGDDYWTDPLKLQKQVDFLEKHPDCSMVFSNAEVLIEGHSKSNSVRGLKKVTDSRIYTSKEILNDWTIPTASVVFRKKDLDERLQVIASNKNFMFGDIVLFLYLSTKGKLFGMKDYMVAYRRHQGGATNFKLDIKFYERHLRHLIQLKKTFGKHVSLDVHYNTMADYALSLGLYNLSNKKVGAGLKYLIMSIWYNPKYITKYIRSKNFLNK